MSLKGNLFLRVPWGEEKNENMLLEYKFGLRGSCSSSKDYRDLYNFQKTFCIHSNVGYETWMSTRSYWWMALSGAEMKYSLLRTAMDTYTLMGDPWRSGSKSCLCKIDIKLSNRKNTVCTAVVRLLTFKHFKFIFNYVYVCVFARMCLCLYICTQVHMLI